MKSAYLLKKVGERATPFTRRERRAWAKLSSRTESFNAVQNAFDATAKAKQEAK